MANQQRFDLCAMPSIPAEPSSDSGVSSFWQHWQVRPQGACTFQQEFCRGKSGWRCLLASLMKEQSRLTSCTACNLLQSLRDCVCHTAGSSSWHEESTQHLQHTCQQVGLISSPFKLHQPKNRHHDKAVCAGSGDAAGAENEPALQACVLAGQLCFLTQTIRKYYSAFTRKAQALLHTIKFCVV